MEPQPVFRWIIEGERGEGEVWAEGVVKVAKPIQGDMLCSYRCHYAIIGIVLVAFVVVVSFVNYRKIPRASRSKMQRLKGQRDLSRIECWGVNTCRRIFIITVPL